MTLTLFGIKSCETVAKARAWLDLRGVTYAFHDYKTKGVGEDDLRRWCQAFGWQKVLNRAGTTFRALPQGSKQDLTEPAAIALMIASPSMIKRPILEGEGVRLIGFRPDEYAAVFERP